MSRPPHSRRIVVFDALRGIAILLAMIDHAKIQFVPDFHALVPLTRFATPSFIILFGIMIEIAYLRKLRQGHDPASIRRRMAFRMVQCAALFAGLTVVAVLSGNLSPSAAVLALLCRAPGRFSEILIIYSLLFAVVLSASRLLRRHGAPVILAFAAIGLILKAIPTMQGTVPDLYIVTFLTGIGQGYGPALLPSMMFLGFGLSLGEVITKRRRPSLSLALLGCAGLVFAIELSHGPWEAGRRFLAHRWTNHPGYYAVGVIGFSVIAAMLQRASRLLLAREALELLARFGRQSLFIYGGGDLLLNLLPTVALSRDAGLILALLFLVIVFGAALLRKDKGRASEPPPLRGASA